MWKKVFNLGPIGRDSLINTSGTFVIGLIGLIFYVLVARHLGPEQFGLFTVAASILVVGADIFDFGTNTGIVRFVAQAISEKKLNQASKIAKFAFVFKSLIGVALAIVGFLISEPLANLVFKQPQLANVLPLAFLGILITLWLGFFNSVLQAFKKFLQAIIINFAANLLRLVAILVLVFLGKVAILTTMAVFAISPILGVFAGWLILPLKGIYQSKIDKDLALKFLGFNKWIAVGFMLAAIQVRLPNFLLVRLSDAVQTGLFSVASALTLFAPQITTALSVTFAPRFAQVKNHQELKPVLQNAIFVTTVFAILTFILIPTANFVFNLTVGAQFLEAVPSFQILVISAFFLILTAPQSAVIIYFWEKPTVYALLSTVQLLIILVLNFLLVPNFGAKGAAIASFVATVVGFLASSFYVILRWRKQ